MTRIVTPKIPLRSGVRWNPEDVKLLTTLRRKLGVSVIQIVRLAIRTLAEKEGMTA